MINASVHITEGNGDHNAPYSFSDTKLGHRWCSAPPASNEALAPCPFCGCDYADTDDAAGLEVCNTFTPSFWVQCNACGTEHHPVDVEFPDTVVLRKGVRGFTLQMFVDARAAAVAAWNNRDTRWRVGK